MALRLYAKIIDIQLHTMFGLPGRLTRWILNQEVELIVKFCKTQLDYASIELPEEYGYSSLPLCVIDAVFQLA